MTSIAVIVPTISRPELSACLFSVVPQLQPGDRLDVVCDNPDRFTFVSDLVRETEHDSLATLRCYPTPRLGCYGHASRNVALDHLAELEHKPDWVWSLDDDDVATFEALDTIRAAVDSGRAPWYVFSMRGGAGSHFNGVVVPATGGGIRRGEIGTPMIIWPRSARARFGTKLLPGHYDFGPAEPGYFGDWEFATRLRDELGKPEWRPEVVAEIRPVPVGA